VVTDVTVVNQPLAILRPNRANDSFCSDSNAFIRCYKEIKPTGHTKNPADVLLDTVNREIATCIAGAHAEIRLTPSPANLSISGR
jgi:hypothetical protein